MKLFCRVIIVGTVGLASLLCSRAANPAEPPLPTLQEVFPRVVERAKREPENDRAFESKFIFVKSRVTDYRNAKGEVKKHEAKISTNHPAQKQLVAGSGGPPAREAKSARPVSGRQSNPRGKAFEKEEFLVNDDLVKRFEFTLVGRDLLNDRPTLVIDFEPAKRKLPERNLKDKFINKVAGRVWLDEEDCAIAKIALRLTERVNVVGGLVGSVWKCTFGFERVRTEEGLWFAREANWHLEGREVFVNRIMDYHETRTDVRRAQ